MSSPISIPRTSSESAHASHSSVTSLASSPGQLYVPVHKRRGGSASPTSSRAPSPTPSQSSSWRSSSPIKASPRKANKFSAFKPTNVQGVRTSIPTSSSIPTPSKNTPLTYSINELLALSSSPATLTPPQMESIGELVELCATPSNNEKAASRRRRTGRRSKPVQQKVVTKTVDVDVRRTRQGHGTWGWASFASMEALKAHQHGMEEPWRHVAIAA